MILPSVPFKLSPAKLAACAAVVVLAWIHGYHTRAESAARDLAAANAVAAATDARYRNLESEVANAQAGYVEAFRRNRDAARADWLRIKAAAVPGRVSSVCPEPGGVTADSGAGLAGDGVEARELIEALVAGEAIGASLRLCQTELRQCAGLR